MTHIMTTMLGDVLFKAEGKFFASREGCDTRQVELETVKAICKTNWIAAKLTWLRPRVQNSLGFILVKTAEVRPGDVHITSPEADRLLTDYYASLV